MTSSTHREPPTAPPESTSATLAAGAPARRRRSLRGKLLVYVCIGWLALLVLAAVLAPILPGLPEPGVRIGRFAQDPDLSVGGLLGTDSVGRSNLARIVYGARVSLVVAVFATLIALVIGLLFGMVGGYYRGFAESVTNVVANALASIPPLLLLLALVSAIGATLRGLTIALGVALATTYIRVTKGAVIANASREYVLAAKALGARSSRVMIRELLPNLVPVLGAIVPITMATAIIVEGSLSFLGYGIPPPTPSWGGMIAAGADTMRDYPIVILGPAVTLFLTVFAFNTVGNHYGNRSDAREAQL
ncbi:MULTISPECIES: ABC transporter permease [unclassified Modestobacter]